MRASVSEAMPMPELPVRRALGSQLSIRKQEVMLNRLFLIGTILGIALAHGIVLYKIDTNARSDDARQVMASRSHRAFW
jgi:hypothetical protein